MGAIFSKRFFPRCSSSRGLVSEELVNLENHQQFYVPSVPPRKRRISATSCLLEEIQVDIFLKLPVSASSALPASSTTCTCHGTILREYPFKDTAVDTFIVLGSCNGLVSIGTSGMRSGIDKDCNLSIWNPSTGEFKNERVPQHKFVERSESDFVKYGVCYDCIDDDNYKLVKISRHTNSGCYQAEVYKKGSEWWKTFLSKYTFDGVRIFYYQILNGAIYFTGFKTIKEVRSKVIVSFDMKNEKFMDSTFPDEADPSDNEKHILQAINGMLCVLIYYPSVPNRIDVWQMQDSGVRESWTKLFTLTTNLITDYEYLKLQWSFASGEILIKHGKGGFIYDPKNNRTKVLEFHGIGLSYIISVNYVESLVSLNSGTFVGENTTIRNKD